MSFLTYRRDIHPFEADTKGRHFLTDVSIHWPSNRKWQTKVSDSCRAPTKKMWKSLKAASCRRTKSERGIFTQKTMVTGWSREISYRSAKTRRKILSSARGCNLLAVCVNLSCLFKNKLGLIFFCGLVFFRGFWNFIFAEIRETAGKWEPCSWKVTQLNLLHQKSVKFTEINNRHWTQQWQ